MTEKKFPAFEAFYYKKNQKEKIPLVNYPDNREKFNSKCNTRNVYILVYLHNVNMLARVFENVKDMCVDVKVT